MPPRRKPAGADRRDDVSGQAGWMYTDLLLGLMIVFMATVSFIPESLPSKNPSAYVYTQRFEQVFEQVYLVEAVNAKIVTQEVAEFLKFYNLPEQSVVIQAQFVGGFDPNVENVTAAINRAVSFSAMLDSENVTLLSKAATSVDSSSQIEPGEIIVRFQFGAIVR